MTAPALPTTRAAHLDRRPANHRWLVDALWAEQGVGVLGGAPKSCKSWLALEMAVAVAAGIECLGHFGVDRPGPTLVYLAEDALPDVRQRIASLCAARQVDIDALDLHVITAPALRLDAEDDFRRLVATVKAIGPRLLVLDPFVRLHRADENRSGEIAAILGRLRTMQRALGTAILIVHHARKATAGLSPGQALRGSTDFYAWVDCLLFLDRTRQGLRLSVEHRAAPAPEPMFVELESTEPHLRLVQPRPQAPERTLDERVLDLIDGVDHPLRRKEIRARLAVNNKRLGQALVRLEQLGQLRRTKDGWTR